MIHNFVIFVYSGAFIFRKLQEEEWKSKHRESLRKEKSQKQKVEEKKEQEESVAKLAESSAA
jgi:hypothetical protein